MAESDRDVHKSLDFIIQYALRAKNSVIASDDTALWRSCVAIQNKLGEIGAARQWINATDNGAATEGVPHA